MSNAQRLCAVLMVLPAVLRAAPLTIEQVEAETFHPYAGPTAQGVDRTTLDGKVVCGYQGWFNAEGDGAQRGWVHWTKGHRKEFTAEAAKIDLWPDVSELSPNERFATGLRHADGRTADVFSSFNKATVLRHFQWMRDYGIDGAMVQRFLGGMRDPRVLRHNNVVLDHCREGANRCGRTYALMYDLSGCRAGVYDDFVADWRRLRTRMHLTDDPAYLRHRGRPVVVVWGVGFADRHKPGQYSLDECRRIVELLKRDPELGVCTVMLGVPTAWRILSRDSVSDPKLHEIIRRADIVSPWTVGRYRRTEEVRKHAAQYLQPDLEWCRQHKLDYLPVVFPGFSWHNMYGAPLDAIPRRGGRFMWEQFCAVRAAGIRSAYVAMFDEVDEGTAIFKCANDVPSTPPAQFVTYEDLPSDFYLRLTGAGRKLIRGEIPASDAPPP